MWGREVCGSLAVGLVVSRDGPKGVARSEILVFAHAHAACTPASGSLIPSRLGPTPPALSRASAGTLKSIDMHRDRQAACRDRPLSLESRPGAGRSQRSATTS